MGISNNPFTRTKPQAWVFICLFFMCTSNFLAHGQTMENHSTVIVKIPEMTDEQYSGIIDGIAKDNQFTFEYACKESNIIVVKYYHRHQERGDVRVASTSSFRKWAKISKLELIYFDFTRGTSGKC